MRSASTLIQWTVSTAQAHSPLTPPVVPPPSPVSRGVPIVVPMPPVVPTPGTGPRPDEVSRGLPALEPLVGSEIAPVPYDDEASRDPNPRETPNIVPVEPGVVPIEPAAIHTITLAAATLFPRLMTASLSIQEIERVHADVIGRRAGVELHGEVGAAQGIDGVIQRLEHGPKYLARRIQLIDAEDDVVSRLAAVVVDVSRDAHVAVPSRVGAPLDVEELGAERGVASGIGRRCRWAVRQCCLPRQDGCRQCGTGHQKSSNEDRKSTRLNSSHSQISYAVFCLKKKKPHIELRRSSRRLKSGTGQNSCAEIGWTTRKRSRGISSTSPAHVTRYFTIEHSTTRSVT